MNGDIAIIIFTAVVTSGLSTIFSYYKEKKFASSKYTQKVLEKLYIPIYKILESGEHRVLGYTGVSYSQLADIRDLAKEKIELCDPKLEKFIRRLDEEFKDAYLDYEHSEEYDEDISFEHEFLLDQNHAFKNYILHSFNRTRKSLGLPADNFYLYPPVYKTKMKIVSMKYLIKRTWRRRKIKRKIRRSRK